MNSFVPRTAVILVLSLGSALTGCISISHTYNSLPADPRSTGSSATVASTNNCGCPCGPTYGYYPSPSYSSGYDSYRGPYRYPYFGGYPPYYGGYYPPSTSSGTSTQPPGGSTVGSTPRRPPNDAGSGYDPNRPAPVGTTPEVGINPDLNKPRPETAGGGWRDGELRPVTPSAPPAVPVADQRDDDVRSSLPEGGRVTPSTPTSGRTESDTRRSQDIPSTPAAGDRANVPHPESGMSADAGIRPSTPRETKPTTDPSTEARANPDAGRSSTKSPGMSTSGTSVSSTPETDTKAEKPSTPIRSFEYQAPQTSDQGRSSHEQSNSSATRPTESSPRREVERNTAPEPSREEKVSQPAPSAPTSSSVRREQPAEQKTSSANASAPTSSSVRRSEEKASQPAASSATKQSAATTESKVRSGDSSSSEVRASTPR